ncbi:MAG: hypothetical protein IFNCLDLE_02605 [Ignavibacteriaceae bacterium]|nr:hypothetical protein [Ignavibacteriaceae bacterium]
MARQVITSEEYKQIEEQASSARFFLTSPRFKFIRNYLKDAKKDIEDKILRNTVKEVHEVHKIADNLRRVFITPKKEQIDGLSEVYKFIEKFFNDMETYVRIKDEADAAEASGKLTIERSKEK